MNKVKAREELLRESRLFAHLTNSVERYYHTNGTDGLEPVYYHRKCAQTNQILDLFRSDLKKSGLTEISFEVVEVQSVAGSPGFKVVLKATEPVE